MKQTAREYLTERGFAADELMTKEGFLFAVIAAKAKEYQRQIEGEEHAQTRAVITQFCKSLLNLSENAKPGLLGLDFEKAVVVNALVRLFADPGELAKFCGK